MSGEFELFDCDMYPEDDEPEHVCTCNVIHDDLEHAENLCNACDSPQSAYCCAKCGLPDLHPRERALSQDAGRGNFRYQQEDDGA